MHPGNTSMAMMDFDIIPGPGDAIAAMANRPPTPVVGQQISARFPCASCSQTFVVAIWSVKPRSINPTGNTNVQSMDASMEAIIARIR